MQLRFAQQMKKGALDMLVLKNLSHTSIMKVTAL